MKHIFIQSFHSNHLSSNKQTTNKTAKDSLTCLSTDLLLHISSYLSQTDFFVFCNCSPKYSSLATMILSHRLNYLLDFPYKWSTLYIYLNNPIELYIYLFRRYQSICNHLVFYGQNQQNLIPFYEQLFSTPNHITQLSFISTNLMFIPVLDTVNMISVQFPSSYSTFLCKGQCNNHCQFFNDQVTQLFSFLPYLSSFKYTFWQFEFFASLTHPQDVRFGFFVNSFLISQITIHASKETHYYHVNDIIRLPRSFHSHQQAIVQLCIKCLTNIDEEDGYVAIPLEGKVTFLQHQSQQSSIDQFYPQFHCYDGCSSCSI